MHQGPFEPRAFVESTMPLVRGNKRVLGETVLQLKHYGTSYVGPVAPGERPFIPIYEEQRETYLAGETSPSVKMLHTS